MSYLQEVASLPRLQRCFGRSGHFWMQHAETIKQIGAKTLQEVVHSRKLKEESMFVFIRLLLDRYAEKLQQNRRSLFRAGNSSCARRVEKLKLEQSQVR